MPTLTSTDRVKAFNKQVIGHFFPFIKIYWIHTGKMSCGERRRSSTVMCVMNAAGNYIPPIIVFAHVSNLDCLMINAHHGSGCAGTKHGWSDSKIFMKWLEHFNNVAKPSIQNSHTLMLDMHHSHKTLDRVKFAKQNGIIMITFPPHSTHKM